MTPFTLSDCIGYIDRMFPASDWTPDMRTLFIERASRINLTGEQAKAVVGEYRVNFRGKTPDMGTLLRRLADAAHASGPVQTERPDDPWRPVAYEWVLLSRWRENQNDPIFVRLRKRIRRAGLWDVTVQRWRNLDGTNGPFDLELERNDPMSSPPIKGGGNLGIGASVPAGSKP